jgi:hypothetical protein
MDSNLQNKLQAFSATPPEKVWSKIADALDANQNFFHRLQQYEATPPEKVWTTIEKELAQEFQTAKVVPFTTRFRRPLRYAAVACFFAVTLVTITLTVRRTEAGALDAGSNTTVPTSDASTRTPEVSKQKNDVAKVPRGQTDDPTSTTKRGSDNPVRSAENTNETNPSGALVSSLNEYVLFRDGDGKTRRVSKKLAGFVKCKDGDEACKQRLQQLRQTLAAKAMNTDFTGILEMLRQLQ